MQRAIELELFRMIALYTDLASFAATHRGCYLMVGSVVPSLAHERVEWAFKKLHLDLRLALRPFPNARFCNFTQQLTMEISILKKNSNIHKVVKRLPIDILNNNVGCFLSGRLFVTSC